MEIKNYQDVTLKFCCEYCNFNTSRKNDYNRHLSTRKHILSSKTSKTGEMEIKIHQNVTKSAFTPLPDTILHLSSLNVPIVGVELNDESSRIYASSMRKDLNLQVYKCNNCSYSTHDKSNYNKHLSSQKHINIFNNIQKNNTCDICNKTFVTNSGLYKHKKKCNKTGKKGTKPKEIEQIENTFIDINDNTTPSFTPALFMEVLKQSKELQEVLFEQNRELQNKLLEKDSELQNKLLEQNAEHHKQIIELTSKQIGNTNINSHNTNNNQFNLQFFLNETCKHAINIGDFVNSLQVQIADLEKTGRLGYVEGISGIFLRGLKELDYTMRPIHCTDLKRETVYVKDENSWERDDDEKAKLKLAIQRVARKNMRTLPRWQAENPDFKILDTKENDAYLKIALNSMGGQNDEEHDKYVEKILRNVLKEVVIEKK